MHSAVCQRPSFSPRALNGVYDKNGTYEERLQATRTSAAPPCSPSLTYRTEPSGGPAPPFLQPAGRPTSPGVTREGDNGGNDAAGGRRGRKRSRAAWAEPPLPPPSALRSSLQPPAPHTLHTYIHTYVRTDTPNAAPAPHPPRPYTPAPRVTVPAAAPTPPRRAGAAPPPACRCPLSAGGIAPRV